MRKIKRKIKRYYSELKGRIVGRIDQKRDQLKQKWHDTAEMRTVDYWKEWSKPHILRTIEFYKMSVALSIKTFNQVKAVEYKKEARTIWGQQVAKGRAVKLRCKEQVLKANPYVLAMFTMCFVIISVASIQIYRSSNTIYEEISAREPASLPAPLLENPRPVYHKLHQKQFSVESLTIPVYIESVNSVKTMIIDFSANASNQYISNFFLKHEFYVKDHLNTTLQPIVPKFPLTIEGKRILRGKIKDELNSLVKRLKIKGEVIDVSLIGVIAS